MNKLFSSHRNVGCKSKQLDIVMKLFDITSFDVEWLHEKRRKKRWRCKNDFVLAFKSNIRLRSSLLLHDVAHTCNTTHNMINFNYRFMYELSLCMHTCMNVLSTATTCGVLINKIIVSKEQKHARESFINYFL